MGRRADDEWAIYGVGKSCESSSNSASYSGGSRSGTKLFALACFPGKDVEASELNKRTERLEAASVER